ncbi:amino acid ABC transporter substrate-binding protein [Bradyrhizobium sp. 83012]|uniref:Amino acid ABC transporter substrate-binding protein n=1 Tax=Bradyrhizobium aeschynomenes TaxID=2734909 RepID=A0ABX2CJ83_9BRAD|nr:amino acid ABC transporter substrate-binding protein [Bradyrhizobium aeschynomenes]NPU15397.1 amino acid ABC transporter substrate-binding protein [Bradyrhizobium aeschynomenes]NPU68252.1 amino acid ABC transporter substrate-binding protein [Bradyrhizobium aeschynomenes]NPV25584.1 amino acid ABC transporter substrate-binding protein [Bradyrhizobium aeschynomenes]
MTSTNRRQLLRIAGAAAIAAGFGATAAQAETDKIRIGYAISKTGPYAGGAGITTLPNYQLWVKDVNAAGGIKLGDKKLPVEIVEYDDRSSSEEAVKAIERLANQDKVDFILSPWGTGLNLAVGPTLNKLGYPHLAVTSVTDKAPELAKRWANATFWLGTSAQISNGLAELLGKLKSEGKIGGTVAMVSVADQFGIELAAAGREAFKKAGLTVAYDKTYPMGSQDLQPLLKDAIAANADAFIAFSYPPDTIGLTEQAQLLKYNPKVFYVGVGTAFPLFKGKFAANSDGVMGIGGWNADSPPLKDYLARHKAATGQEPDRWASSITYASLQVLQQAIEKVGKVDRAAVAKEIREGSFDTIIGKVKLKDGLLQEVWSVGQWQNGEFYALAPASLPGARAAVVPKPEWK